MADGIAIQGLAGIDLVDRRIMTVGTFGFIHPRYLLIVIDTLSHLGHAPMTLSAIAISGIVGQTAVAFGAIARVAVIAGDGTPIVGPSGMRPMNGF